MTWPMVRKTAADRAAASLPDPEAARKTFGWADARVMLDGLPGRCARHCTQHRDDVEFWLTAVMPSAAIIAENTTVAASPATAPAAILFMVLPFDCPEDQRRGCSLRSIERISA